MTASADTAVSTPVPAAAVLVPVERVRRAIQLRTAPKREVTPSLLADDLDDYRRGSTRITRLWEDLMEEDEALVTVVSKRKDAVSRLRWEIQIDEDKAGADSAEAGRHQEVLQGFYSGLRTMNVLAQDERGGVGLLARQLLDAKAHGFAALEWVWKPAARGRKDATTAEFRRCPPWWFENRTGRLRYLVQDWDVWGVDMDPKGWLVAGAPALMKPSSVLWLYKNLSLRDWLGFSEKFGMPGLIGETTADKDSPEWLALVNALKNFGPDFALVINEGAKITPISVSAAASLLPYPPLIEMLTRAIYALWLGGDLSTLSAQSGQGQGASLQGAEAAKIEDDDARFISEVCQERIDRAVIEYTFGEGVQPLAYFKLCPPTRQNTKEELEVDTFLAGQGLPQSRAAVYARYNRPMPEEGDDVVMDQPPQPAPAAAAEVGLANSAPEPDRRALFAAMARDLAPIRQRLERILVIEDPAILQERLIAFRDELPALLRDINADPASAREMEKLFAVAMQRGLETEPGSATPESIANGDEPGHPFRGNQHVGGEGGGAAEAEWSAAMGKKEGGRKKKLSIDQTSAALAEKGFELGAAEPYQPGMGTRYKLTHKASGQTIVKTAAEIEKFVR